MLPGGVRMAFGAPMRVRGDDYAVLGAHRGRVVGLMLRHGLGVVAVGLALGLAASIAIGQALSGVLFGVSPADPVSLGGASIALTLAALAACYLPARRASRLDPLRAIRQP